MSHYKSNLRDIEFNLFEVFGRDQVLGSGPFAEVDADTAREILHEVDRLAREELAPSFETADRNPPVFDPATHSVTMPEDFTAAYQALHGRRVVPARAPRGARWPARTRPASSGRVAELVLGANPPIHLYSAGPGFATVIYRNGTERDQKIARHMIDRTWGATMVLTEPDAGSDVGAGPHQGDAAGRRQLAHRGRQALHHLSRARHEREHRAPRPRPPGRRRGRRRPGHQGPVAVRRPEAPTSTSRPAS